MNIAFQLKNEYFPRKFIESAAKGTQTSKPESVVSRNSTYYDRLKIVAQPAWNSELRKK